MSLADNKQLDAQAKPAVLQIVRHIGPGGGINGVAFELEKNLAKAGYAVEAYTLGNLLKLENRKPLKSLILSKLRLIFDIVLFTIVGTLRAVMRFRRSNTVVVCHADVLSGDIYVNHGLHREMVRSSPSPLKTILRNPFHLFLLGREWLRFKANIHKKVVCFSQEEAATVLKHYHIAEEKIAIISNGVNVKKFTPNEQFRAETRSELGVDDNAFLLIFVGHEFRRKGLSIAVDALLKLPEHVSLIVVGGGTESEIATARKYANTQGLSQRVKFLGTRHDVNKLMCAADCFILPTHYETWALVGLEAMSCGTPVLMTAVGGIKEYVEDGRNGLYIQRTAEDIVQKVNTLIDHPEMFDAMKIEARNTALKYSWESIAGQYAALIQEVSCQKAKRA